METQPSIVLFNTFLADAKFNGLLFTFIILLIILSAFFSMSETAFTTASETKLRIATESKVTGAKKAIYLYDHYDKTLTTLLIGNNLVNVALSTIAVIFFTQLAINENIVGLVSTVVVTIVLLIFGEIIPKMIAKMFPESICAKTSWIIYIISFIFWPFVMMFTGIQIILQKVKRDDANIEKEELEVIFKELKDSGEMEESEAEALQNVLDMKDRSVEDIMVPRIKVSAIDYSLTLEEVKNFMLDNPYSRIPVYKTDKDHIIGILYERDFFPALVKNPKTSWRKLIRPVKFVSKTMKTDNLIKELQISKTHLAVVVGEYGDTLGIVTMEDALEELVGEIYDEHDVVGSNDIRFEEQEDGTYLVDAEMFVDDLFDKLNVGDIPEDVPSKLSGWLLEKCEALPTVGYKFDYFAAYTREDEEGEYNDYNKILTIEIAAVENRAITLAKVALRDATEEEIEKFEED